MNLLQRSLLALGVLLIAHTGFSQEKKDTTGLKGINDTLKLTVGEAQKYALEYNRSVKAAKIDIEIAKKKIWETTAIGLPQFTTTADYQHIFQVPELSFPTVGFSNERITGVDDISGFTQDQPFGSNGPYLYSYTAPAQPLAEKDNVTFNFTVSQLIFSGEYIVGLQASKVYKELSEKNYVKSEQATNESVATSYYMVLVISENIKVLNESLSIINKTYNDIVKMQEQGFTEDTDVDQLKINKANVQTLINSLESQREVALKLLKFQLGVDFEQTIYLKDSIKGIIENGNFQYLSSSEFNVDNSVDYELMKTQEGLMLLALRRQRTTFLPTISAFYNHQELLKEPVINFQPKDVLGASVNFPIFTSGQRLSKVAQAKFDLSKTRLAKTDVEQSLIMEFERAKNDYQTAFNNYITNKESMELSQKIYNKTIIKYSEGVSSSLDLTQSQNQYLTSESNYYSSALTLLSSKAKLDRILIKYARPN